MRRVRCWSRTGSAGSSSASRPGDARRRARLRAASAREDRSAMNSLPLLALVAIFAGAAAAVWVAGIKLSDTTDVLAERLGLGEALGGLILLAVATNLPEIAITVSAALAHALGIAVGNILGGIAIQTVVLAVIDVVALGRREPLTYRAASLTLVLEATIVIAVLVVVVMGTQLPASLAVARLDPGGVAVAVLWVPGLWVLW